MGMFDHRETMKGIRKANADVLKKTLESLKDESGNDVSRNKLADSAKKLVDDYVAVETSYSDLEYSTGKVVGWAETVGVQILGVVIGGAIGYLIKNKK